MEERSPEMNDEAIEYVKSLKPAPHRPGNELLQEGHEIGDSFEAGRSRFIRESNGKYATHMDLHREAQREGRILWNVLLGLATLEDQIEGIQKLYEFSQASGLGLTDVQCIPSGRVGLPAELRDKAPTTTSYIMDGLDDYVRQVEAAPMNLFFCDHHLVVPNAIETTVNALKVGSPRVGEFSQFTWDYPGFTDNVKRFSDMVTALGIMASKRDEMFTVETYLDDGFPSYFIDYSSHIGYTLLEHYICSTLCNARYSVSFAGLIYEPGPRVAIAVALHKLLSTEEQPVMTYINGSTTLQWDTNIHGNYGLSAPEMLFEIAAEKHYRMGLGINPVSITEKANVATVQDLIDIYSAGKRAEEMADEYLPYLDFRPIDDMVEVLVREGQNFLHNALQTMEAAGIDITDPLEMLLTVKAFDPLKFERAFHSSTQDDLNAELVPYYPSALARDTIATRNAIIGHLKEEGLEGSLAGKSVVVCSGDAHSYGLLLVSDVLAAMGATVINGGVDMDAVDVLDLADEEGVSNIAISCHNGQALDYGRELLQMADQRNKRYCILLGGKLNALLPGNVEPVDIDWMLRDLGIHAYNSMDDYVHALIKEGL
jgi:hypothetical protein